MDKRCLLLILCLITFNVYASSGTLKQDSIIECNGEYFGNHGNPLHWHRAIMKNGKWISSGEEVAIPSCYIRPVNTFEEVSFSKCVDGDTAKFIINGKEETVRFLAIDTPESVKPNTEVEYYAKDASDYTCKILKDAKKITLEYDASSDKEDKYGRILAFVYIDDELLEAKLISLGYAKVAYIYGDYKHVDELKKLEGIAKENKVGIWNDSLPDIKEDMVVNEKETIWNNIMEIVKIVYHFIIKIFA